MSLISAIPMWAFIAVAALLVMVLLFRTMNQVYLLSLFKKNIFYIIALGFLALFAMSIINIHQNNEFDFSTLEGVRGVVKVYLNWFSSLGKNIVEITGYAINQDWVAQGNSTGGKS